MTFTYPAVITPHKDDDGFHIVFPDLELCEGDGPDLEDALDDAREAAYNWLMLELEEGGEFPAQSHEEDIEVPEGGFRTPHHRADQTAAGQRLIRTKLAGLLAKATASFMLDTIGGVES